MFGCTCNTQNSLLLNQHNGDAPQDSKIPQQAVWITRVTTACTIGLDRGSNSKNFAVSSKALQATQPVLQTPAKFPPGVLRRSPEAGQTPLSSSQITNAWSHTFILKLILYCLTLPQVPIHGVYNDVALFLDVRIREWGRLLGIRRTLYIRMSVSEPSCCPSACLSCGTCLYWNRFSAQPHKPDQRTNAKMLTVGLSKLIIIYLNKFLRY